MLATIETVEIMDHAERLAQEIIQSEVGLHYLDSLKKMRLDQAAQEKIRTFNSMKDSYEEVQRFGRYHPDYRTVTKAIREAKREMDLHPSIIEYKQAENHLQQLLDEVSVLIGHSVSPHIKVPTGNPFFESSCGGGCGSGGSCGCS
ncbi:regulator [Bacillus sp. FJAT-27916]|uniref:YlbF family regulator n=1 Tax=Bacillaceae TaxID=186817 RepID=UPI000671424A|nr:YlbF family regulator [Bacillus sp. FJAT-27916]KMY45107.1 regulator [Bacillus sp. FJAT-27916]